MNTICTGLETMWNASARIRMAMFLITNQSFPPVLPKINNSEAVEHYLNMPRLRGYERHRWSGRCWEYPRVGYNKQMGTHNHQYFLRWLSIWFMIGKLPQININDTSYGLYSNWKTMAAIRCPLYCLRHNSINTLVWFFQLDYFGSF